MLRIPRCICFPSDERVDLFARPLPTSADYGITSLGRRALAALDDGESWPARDPRSQD